MYMYIIYIYIHTYIHIHVGSYLMICSPWMCAGYEAGGTLTEGFGDGPARA